MFAIMGMVKHMKIISIQKTKGKTSDKYKLKLEDGEELILQDQIIIDHNLLFKKEIDETLRFTLAKENAYYEIYHKTVSYIMKKLRSELEIKKYLEKYQLSKQDEEKLIHKLKSLHFIDDALYAKSYVADKLNFTNEGPLKLKSDLEQQKIDSSIIEEVIEKIELEPLKTNMIRWCEKKVRLNKKYSATMMKQKLTMEMNRLGYSKDFIVECLEAVSFSNSQIIESEYQKLRRKFEKKYQEKELYYKVKEKLYQKGFSSEEINSVMK